MSPPSELSKELQRKRAKETYINFVREGVGPGPIWNKLRHQIYFGDEQFITKHQEMLNDKSSLNDIPILQKRPVAKPIGYYQEKYKDKKQAIYRAYLSGGYTLKELGEHFEKHYTTISRIVKNIEIRSGKT